ncbi:MAG TPA: ABC transporter substrate-binding protein [Egibacteraceae bacterium]|nr:ABC transporter substrate-binding protein [Egibacteraceae bacterium]
MALLVALALALTGCPGQEEDTEPETDETPEATDEAPERVTLRLPGGDQGFPSPFGYMRGPGYVQTSFIYDTLVWKDASGEVLPWLASGFEESDDGLTYTFELREGITWHDGEPFTAQDVVFTFAYFDQQQISPQVIVQPIEEIEEVTAVDDHTVEFTLSEPAATFLQFGAAGAVPIVPEHIWSGVDDAAQASDVALLVGTGPYRLEQYSPGEGSYLYTANDDYFLGTPVVERLEFVEVGDPLTALLAGELSAAGGNGLRDDALAPFEEDDRYEILEAPPGSAGTALYWNLARGGALADPQFRRACALAIDREDMVQRLFGGNGAPGNPGWIPPEHPFHAEVEQYAFDLEAANALLDEAGYARGEDGMRTGPDGQPLSFELLVPAPAGPPVDLVVGYLAEIGVQLEPQALDTPSFNQRVLAGETDMSMISFGGMNSDLAPDYLRLIYSTEEQLVQQAQGYENPRVDELAREQLNTLDDDERLEIVTEIQEIVAEDLPLLPLVYPTGFSIHDTEVFDAWYYTPGGVAGVVPTTYNKHAFVTGQETGMPTDS